MKFKSKRHLILSMKKKSAVELSADETKELDTLNSEMADATKAADDAAAAAAKKKKEDEDKKAKEDADKKAADEANKTKDDGAAGSVTLEALAEKLDQLASNMQMLMEGLATVLESAPADSKEEKETDAEVKPEEEAEDDAEQKEVDEDEDSKEEELSEEDMEKELEKVTAELESLDN